VKLFTILFVILFVILFSSQLYASEISIIEKLKVFITSLIGDEAKQQVVLPVIPTVGARDRASLGYEQSKKNNISFSENDTKKYNYSFIKELFKSVRQKEIGENELFKWLNVLSQSGSREGIYRALVLDQTYLGLENYDFAVNEQVVDYSIKYMNSYLGQDFDKDKLMALNFYTIKRNLIEKTLEIVDILFKRPTDDIYDWYAVFSADVARHFPDLWKNSMRKKSKEHDHKAWAKKVPDQYIKSEIIIKMHRIFNHLQNS
jgi:hypothetical protein